MSNLQTRALAKDYLRSRPGRLLGRSSSSRNVHLAIIPNCNAEKRCEGWQGALNGQQRVGCGINVLRFIEEMDGTTAAAGLKHAIDYGQGTPFGLVVDWFNHKAAQTATKAHFLEQKYWIDTRERLAGFLDSMYHNLDPDSCAIVKYNRPPQGSPRYKAGLTPGHYVLMFKDARNKLWTYEPYLSHGKPEYQQAHSRAWSAPAMRRAGWPEGSVPPEYCSKREYKGVVSENFFKTYYDDQNYETASTLLIKMNPGMVAGGPGKNNLGMISAKEMDEFAAALTAATECVNPKSRGGRKKKRKDHTKRRKGSAKRRRGRTKKRKGHAKRK